MSAASLAVPARTEKIAAKGGPAEPAHLTLRLGADPLASLNHVIAQASRFPQMLPAQFRRALRDLMRTSRADLSPLRALMVNEPTNGAPLFLGELAGPGVITFASQLEVLNSWSDTDIRCELDRVCAGREPVPELKRWGEQPARARDDYVRALRVFEQRVFSRLLPNHQLRQRREVERWAAAAAMSSTATLISMLTAANPNLYLASGTLRLRAVGLSSDGTPYHFDNPVPKNLWLFPTMGGERTVRHSDKDETPEDLDFVAFATPGLRITAKSASFPSPTSSALTSVLGPVHAAIVEQLARRAVSTTELAPLIDRAPSTTSEHLNNLCERGLVAKRRCGLTVRYELTELGDRLVGAFQV